MEHLIKSKKEYYEMMMTIYTLMNKGEVKLTKAAAHYEEDNVAKSPF